LIYVVYSQTASFKRLKIAGFIVTYGYMFVNIVRKVEFWWHAYTSICFDCPHITYF